MMNNIQVWTDGSITKNPGGTGGWAAFMVFKERARLVTGYELNSTNNRMEAQAVIGMLMTLRTPCSIDLFTDSQYVQKCIDSVLKGKLPKLNQDLWKTFKTVILGHKIKTTFVRGHTDDPYNELVDIWARHCAFNKKAFNILYPRVEQAFQRENI